jgi:hypothetical protein
MGIYRAQNPPDQGYECYRDLSPVMAIRFVEVRWIVNLNYAENMADPAAHGRIVSPLHVQTGENGCHQSDHTLAALIGR